MRKQNIGAFKLIKTTESIRTPSIERGPYLYQNRREIQNSKQLRLNLEVVK